MIIVSIICNYRTMISHMLSLYIVNILCDIVPVVGHCPTKFMHMILQCHCNSYSK